ncbi:MAG: hypothetical protein RR588_14350, partial [Solibacillus sp.]
MRLERNGAQFIHCPSFLTVWQCDVRTDSRSVREKYYNASLQWFEQHQQELSKKAQLGYKLHFIFPELLRNKQFKKMVHFLVESRKTHQLSTFHLMKKMTLIGLYATKLKKFNRETRAVE